MTQIPHIGKAKNIPAQQTLLLPYQTKWVKDKSRLKLAVKSRQVGWTWATAYSVVSRICLTGRREDIWISSRDETQARLFLEDCLGFARLLDWGARECGESVLALKRPSGGALEFCNGRRVFSLSSNPDAQAGKRGDRVLDEFALHPDPRKLYSIAYPGITWGGSLEIFSTHRGSGNFFNSLVNEILENGNPKKISFHCVTLQDALDQGFLFKLQGKLSPEDARQGMDEGDYFNFLKTGCADEESFLQEYMGVPGDDRSAFLSYDMISGCEYGAQEARELSNEELANGNRPLFVGVDIGRDHDLTVFWVLERVGDVLLTRRVVLLKGQGFDVQEEALYGVLRISGVRRCCIDQTGIGRQFVERAQQKFGKYKVEGITFTAAVKEELAYPVRMAFESRKIKIPQDPFIRSDLRAIRKETTLSGNVRFTADRGKNGHADRFWALALGVFAAKQQRGSFGVATV